MYFLKEKLTYDVMRDFSSKYLTIKPLNLPKCSFDHFKFNSTFFAAIRKVKIELPNFLVFLVIKEFSFCNCALLVKYSAISTTKEATFE